MTTRVLYAVMLAVAWTVAAADAPAPPAAPPVPGAWLPGWPLRVVAVAAEQAECYDLIVQHDGLARPDARDVRVQDPVGRLVSFFVAYADAARFRLLVDGVPGPGTYFVYFGELTNPQLPPVPHGISPFGRPEWWPRGGFTAVSLDPLERLEWQNFTNLAQVQASVARIRQRLPAATADEAQKQPDASKRRRFALRTIHRGSNTDLCGVDAGDPDQPRVWPGARVPQQWLHTFRAQVQVGSAGARDLVIADSRTTGNLGVLYVDGKYDQPVITGWHSTGATTGGLVFDVSGKVDLTAGRHVFEFLTTRRNPEIKWGLAGSGQALVYLTGLDADYDGARRLTVGDLQPATGTLAEAFLTAIRQWGEQQRFALARELARVARQRFAADAELVGRFVAAAGAAEEAAYAANWLTEGKDATRAGCVPEAACVPPLRKVGESQEGYTHDQRHLSSAVWVEGRAIYGLPFDVQDVPWAITSGITVSDGILYVGTKNGVMHAMDVARVAERWTFPTEGACLGSPLLYRETLHFGTLDRRFYAVDCRTGRMLWNFPTKGWIEGSPCAASGRVFCGSRDQGLYALDAALGVVRWRAALGGEIVATPVTDGQRVYVGTRGGEFVAVAADTGAIVWRYRADGPIHGGAGLGREFVCFGDLAGRLHRLRITDGQSAWQEPVSVGGPVVAAPILVGGLVYGGTENGKLFGVNAADGVVAWQADMPWGGAVTRPPLFADGRLVFVSRQRDVLGPDGNVQQLRGGTVVFQPVPPPAK